MFDFEITKQIAKQAKLQNYSLLKKYTNGKTGALIYRGFFGGRHNFAYAQLSTIEEPLHSDIKKNHLTIKRYY